MRKIIILNDLSSSFSKVDLFAGTSKVRQKPYENIKNSQLVLLKDCGRFPYIEKPQELFDTLAQFLSTDT